MTKSEQIAELAKEILRLRDLAAVCYAGLVAECDLPEQWADVFRAASEGHNFSTEGLLPFSHEAWRGMDTHREWVDAPDWARWLAQNPAGEWFFYERRPQCLQYMKEWHSKGRKLLAKYDDAPIDWRKNIVKVCR